MNLIEVTRQFRTEDDCLDYIERMRWPSEKGCIKCGSTNISQFKREKAGKNKRTRLYQCLEKECGYQFSPTADTVFADSHLPLRLWFTAMALICEAKKGISAKQVARHLGMEKSYKTVWYLCHRIRKAMKEGGLLTGVVEADETYLTPKKPRKGKPYVKKEGRDVVLGMIERGGKLRLVPVRDAKIEIIEPILAKHISPDATLHTDEHPTYAIIGKRRFEGKHRAINHSRTYAIGDLHTNTIENAFSLLKRGIYGTFHKVSIKHLGRYCEEFSYRFNRRSEQAQMFDATLKGLLREKQLPFKTLTASEISDA
jgi:transposase-like protein